MLCMEKTNVFFSHCRGPPQVGPCQSQTFRRSAVSHCCSFGWLKSTTRHKQPQNPSASEGQGHSHPYPIFLQDSAAVGRGGEEPLTDGAQGRAELNLGLRGSEESANIQHLLPFLFPELLWEACPVSKGINSGTCHLSSPCPCVPTFETATSLI